VPHVGVTRAPLGLAALPELLEELLQWRQPASRGAIRLDFFNLPYPLGELWDENLVYVGPPAEEEEFEAMGPDDPELVRELESLVRHPRALVRSLAFDALARLDDERIFTGVMRRSGRGDKAAAISEAQLLELARTIWLGTFDRDRVAPAAWAAWRQLVLDAWKVGDATPGWIDRVSVLFAPEDWREFFRQIDDMPWPVARYGIERAELLLPAEVVDNRRLQAIRRSLGDWSDGVSVPPTSEWRAQWAYWQLADLDRHDPRLPLAGAQAIRWLELSGQIERAEGLSALFRQWVAPDHVLFDQIAVPPDDAAMVNLGVVRQAIVRLEKQGVLGRIAADTADVVDFLAETLWDLVPLYLRECPAPTDGEAWGLVVLALARALVGAFGEVFDRASLPPSLDELFRRLRRGFAEEIRRMARRTAPVARRIPPVVEAVSSVLEESGVELIMRLVEMVESFGPFDEEDMSFIPPFMTDVSYEEETPPPEDQRQPHAKTRNSRPRGGKRSPKS
jgi:hypothetical protein